MGVFPAASSKHVPEPWAKLMSDPVGSFIFRYEVEYPGTVSTKLLS